MKNAAMKNKACLSARLAYLYAEESRLAGFVYGWEKETTAHAAQLAKSLREDIARLAAERVTIEAALGEEESQAIEYSLARE